MQRSSTPARHALARAVLSLLVLPPAAMWPAGAGAQAVQAAAPAPAPVSEPAPAAPAATVVITGNPLGREQLAQPSSVLSGDGLTLRRAGSLGETLDGLPGVAATGFGPQSSRPVIRGLDGDRVRLLDNGGASVDASNLSFDHAPTLDPLVAERIEILRGPAALLYGGNATGGVVNAIDNRIPRTAAEGLSGRAELRLGGAARERAGAALVEGGAGGWSWHADVAGRRSDDLRTPRFSPPSEDGGATRTRRVANSEGDSRSGALGASWADADGFIGASIDGHDNDYGVAVEPDVMIRMHRERVAVAGERRRLAGPFTQVEFQASRTHYRHEEVEGGGEVGTTFKSTGEEMRVQARHRPLGPLRGVIGLQAEQLEFSALGEEAFVPATRTRSLALFMLEEASVGPATLTAGLRWERVRVSSKGDPADAEEPRFGASAERRFTPRSASLGATLPAGGGWTLSASAGATERAPAYYELFADGVHVATGAYERGDPDLRVERSRHVELGAEWRRDAHRVKASVFQTRFSRYIGLDATGREIPVVDEDGEAATVPEYAFSAVRARLRGLELEGRTRLLERPWTLDLEGGFDMVRGDNLDTGEPLARLAPQRVRAGVEAGSGAWRLGARVVHAARQDRVPAFDVPTSSSTVLNLWASWRTALPSADALWFVRLDNVTNELAYNASAIRTVRELSPQGARALTAGVRVSF
ncbi:TonB-dependent receptor [Aquincola sp. MAHUQ-54]|uniref:TonB-dependent receptor n=1 Tax=Aquincola agrisoli TaxID=3119538 RepID=A0AAW9Q6U9_9BURK